ncbi:FAD-dependent oxidoreductase [candidate division WWE3 bacterium]|nr:FAD-dependent oxidoreductase [candidate division WWE3 bacterium]
MRKYDFDLLIIGGGAAGLSAAIYAVRYNLSTVVVSFDFGGQVLDTGEIENWPGTRSILGHELSHAYENHARALGANLVYGLVKSIKPVDGGFEVEVDSQNVRSLFVKTVIMSAGAKHRKLGIEGEQELAGRGISYCVTCDGPFFKNKEVAIIGGGDAAVTGAIDMTVHASKIYLIHRREEFKAKPAYVDMARSNPKIEVITNINVVKAQGEKRLEGIVLDRPYKGSDQLKVEGLFIEIGFLPETQLAKDLGIKFDDQGYVDVAKDQSTNIPGIFAAGDITNASNRFAQLVTAAAEGSIAAVAAFRYVQGLKRT